MGLPLARLVAVCLALSVAGSSESQQAIRSQNHGHNVCSTWGDFHYKTFDGDIYRFPGLCEYNLASDCRDSYKEFSVHLKRAESQDGGLPQIQSVLLTLRDDAVYLTSQLAMVNGAVVSTPHYSSGLLIERNEVYTKVYSRVGLTLMWDQEDSLMLELDSKFGNSTCGLCGDYNGLQSYSEFISDGVLFSALEFGNMQKVNTPEEQCEDPEEATETDSCSEHRDECERLLTLEAFEDCQDLVSREPYVSACVQDRCRCASGDSCLCSTVAEFSRQCSHAGGQPGNWRNDTLCSKSCPYNMVYLESGSPCVDSCSHLEVSRLCEDHRMDGCFCPEGTVYDDITGKGCIPASQCSCRLHGQQYAPGREVSSDCEQCVCSAGRWECKQLPCPGTCALEGGAHITTFDGKKYTFHGDCYYVLAKDNNNNGSYALLGELAPCGSTEQQTCLKSLLLLADDQKNVVAFRSDGTVLLNQLEMQLPHVTASFSVLRPSSNHIALSTAFGLRLQVQLAPVMQLFLTLDQDAQGQVQGLCGNFNGLEGDDFQTAGGLVEATGASFANTWKAHSSCKDKDDWLDDPCTLSVESANYAEHWCSLLKNRETAFGRCHAAVDPTEYYKRCKYDTCNCQNNEDCLCAALSSYAHACAARGVMLWGWRDSVCNSGVDSCSSSQLFLYNLTTCQQTCRALSDPDAHCLQGFVPVDGCGCPDHTFLDERGRCVSLAKCSCYHRGLYLEAGDVVVRQDERCVCRNGRLHCAPLKLLGQSCAAPKIYVDCNNLTALAVTQPRPVSCQTLAASYYHTECISGCVCPDGLMDDGRGGCVVEEECPCVHNRDVYSPGDKITVECNSCTCQGGRWVCTQSVCYGSCAIYGSGHYITFDGKHYDFDGHCSYVAVQDYCGQNSSLGSFSVITENVPCGTTGVTCSKAIKIFLGRTELKLEDKKHVVIQRNVGHHVAYTTREVGQYLVVEASIGVIVIWDKKTTVFVKLAPSYEGAVCGLCGNFDYRSSNDFTTRDHMVVSSELDFGNSWKEASSCPDVSSVPEPCSLNPHRQAWAEKQCSILKSSVFSACHSKVDPTAFYEACVHDSCSCDTGGDCECFCSAVAAYAQQCTKEGACVFWRTPDLCPVFCDYYNPPHECEWHYEPCGNSSFETCRTLNGIHSNISVSYLEGCYPRCPKDRPIYDEDLKKCVSGDKCGCYVEDTRYLPGESVPTEDICKSCVCTNSSHIVCRPEEGKIVNWTQDGVFCYWETCGPNGTLEKHFNICASTTTPPPTPTRPFTPTVSTTTTLGSSTTTLTPESSGDIELIEDACGQGWATNISCRATMYPHIPIEQLGQTVVCDVSVGLECKNKDQKPGGTIPMPYCINYAINVYCCKCASTPAYTTTTATSTQMPATTTTQAPSAPDTTLKTPPPTPGTTTTATPSPAPGSTSTGIPTPTPSTTMTGTSSPAPGSTSTGIPTPTPSTTMTGTSSPAPGTTTSGTPFIPPGTTSTGIPTPTPGPTTTGTSSPAPGSTSTGIPTPTPSTTMTGTSSPAPGTTTSGTPFTPPGTTMTGTSSPAPGTTTSGTPFIPPGTTSTGIPTPTPGPTTTGTSSPAPGSTSTGIPTPTPGTTTTGPPFTAPSTTSSRIPIPTPGSTTTGTPSPVPGTTITGPPFTTPGTTSTGIPTPIPGTTTTGTPSPTPGTTTTGTPTHTPTPTTTSTVIPTPPGIVPTTESTTPKSQPESSTPPTSQSTSSLSTESTTLLTISSPASETSSTPVPSSSTAPTITTTEVRTTSSPPGSQVPTPSTTAALPGNRHMEPPFSFLESHPVPVPLVYNGTHGDTCYYVNCSLSCTLEFYNWSCPSTPSPTPTPSKPTPTTTSSKSTSSPTPSTPATTKPSGCPDFDPPRQENETWRLCECFMATCKHDNTVEIVEVECKPPPMPTCSNGLKPVSVLDPDGCCWHWECDCYCTGWGDPHYVTFDGLYYSYQGNCTYVLVEEITPTVDNFGVYIDNYHCDVNDKVSCPRTLIVRHETQEVLMKTVQMAPMEVQVQVNKQTVALPYKKYGLQVYESGVNYVVDIPELGALVSYNGLSFSIRLPYRLFGNNTKGQCGTCTNTTADDCTLPSGEVVSSCEIAADQWIVNDPSKPHCPQLISTTKHPATTVPGGSSLPLPEDCVKSRLCELIKDSVFMPCHTLVDPQYYYKACVFDSCFVPNEGMECASLQAYAALCAQQGACIDWRDHTQGTCSVQCPSHREYRACGPAEEPTCKSSSNSTAEGCFCPQGTTSYAAGYDVCVETCGCVGPDNVPREFGESFEFDCKACVCLEGGSGIVCQPKECGQSAPSFCEEDGTSLVTEVNPADTCCNVTFCKCNSSLCQEKPPVCSLGFEVKSETVSGRCCPVYSCGEQGRGAGGTPGSPVYSSECQHCVCTKDVDNSTSLNVIACTHVSCNVSCGPGFDLVEAPGQCCKKCEQTHCVMDLPQGQHILKPGDIQSDPSNNCTFFSCMRIHNQLISSISNITCPDFDPSTCVPGSITLMPNGCCRTCIPRNETRTFCSTVLVTREISYAGCTKLVTMNDCSGSCGTFVMYSEEAQSLDHRCTCCKEERTSQRKVVLSCPDGGSLEHTYTHIESCLCQDTVCGLPKARQTSLSRARRSLQRVGRK
uniref:Mucin-2 n=1 Tax=Prolemur simus TaxID=1328070 RepID=A0A8C9DH92_PROSS